MSEPRPVHYAIAASLKGDTRCNLCQTARSRTLQRCGVELADSQSDAIGSQFATEQADPFAPIDIRVLTLMLRRSQQACFCPRDGHVPEGHEVILSLDFGQLGVERQ